MPSSKTSKKSDEKKKIRTCEQCGGRGVVACPSFLEPLGGLFQPLGGALGSWMTCSTCKGEGTVGLEDEGWTGRFGSTNIPR